MSLLVRGIFSRKDTDLAEAPTCLALWNAVNQVFKEQRETNFKHYGVGDYC